MRVVYIAKVGRGGRREWTGKWGGGEGGHLGVGVEWESGARLRVRSLAEGDVLCLQEKRRRFLWLAGRLRADRHVRRKEAWGWAVASGGPAGRGEGKWAGPFWEKGGEKKKKGIDFQDLIIVCAQF